MIRSLGLALLFAASGSSAGGASDVFRDGFELVPITPLFPLVDGRFQLPDSPVATQLDWLLDELAAGEVTTESEVNAHFSPAWLAGISAAATVNFINSVRSSYPDAFIADLITATPTELVATLRSPSNNNVGFMVFGARYAETQRINRFGVSGFNGNSVIFAQDQNLSIEQAADAFMTISSDAGLLVASIDDSGTCVPIVARNANTLRATASIFKTWVLGGAAQAVRSGQLALDEPITLVASEIAPGGSINIEPLGTMFPAIDIARLMLGISDNTATDLLHERVGRMAIDDWVSASGVADPDVLRPLLKINEQFHVFRTLSRTDADAYVDGTENYQYAYLPTLEGLGPLTSGPNFWVDLLVDGTWRASPMDVCANFAALREFGSDARTLVDAALGASVAQPNVRGDWDRVWYKGGSLAQAANQFNVFTHAWLLERNGQSPLVLVALSNSPNGAISGLNNGGPRNDIFDIQSLTGRLLELMETL